MALAVCFYRKGHKDFTKYTKICCFLLNADKRFITFGG